MKTGIAPATPPSYPDHAPLFSTHLDKRLFHQAIEEALPLGLQLVKLTGGEPFSHPEISEFLAFLEEKRIPKVVIETNGAGVTQEHAACLAHIAANGQQCHIAIGFTGANAATHEQFSGKPGSFNAALHSTRLFVQAGLAPQLVFTLTRQNYHQIQQMIELSESLGVSAIRFNPLVPGHLSFDPQVLKVEELIAMGRRVERDLAPSTHARLIYDQPPAFRGLNPSGPIEIIERCSVLEAISILPGGYVTLCGAAYASPGLIMGQLGVDPLEQIWLENPILCELRSNIPFSLEGTCTRCSLRTSCLGHCVVQNYLQKGSFWGPFWFCDDAERVGLFPASRFDET